MVFCNEVTLMANVVLKRHNPYFSRWFSAMGYGWATKKGNDDVTILILVDGFLQY